MKKFTSTIFLTFICLSSFAQGAFDKSIAEISSDLADKLSLKGKKKVVVLYVTDINKATTVAGKYIADVISNNIVNNSHDFQVFDRENLSGIVEAKKMIAEGYIDVDKAKELGKLLSVDGIIIGNYTMLSNTIKLTIKALDSNTGFVIAASMKDLPLDSDAGALLGINVSSSGNGGNNNNDNLGFNNPINSNEKYNNPETVKKDCKEKNIGDYCFYNSTRDTLCVNIKVSGNSYNASFFPGETQCFYSIQASPFQYYIVSGTNKNYGRKRFDSGCSYFLYSEGQIIVEQCKSKTFTIK